MKVFIADTSADEREKLLSLLFESPDVEVIGQAQYPFQLLYSVSQLNPDMLLISSNILEGNDFQLIEKIKTINPNIFIVVLKNNSIPGYPDKMREAGATFVFEKNEEYEKIPELCESIFAG